MPYVVAEPCLEVFDGSCREICPVNCIYLPEETLLLPKRRRNKMYVNPEECIECGACLEVCPVNAIQKEREVPGSWQFDVVEQYEAFELSRPGR